MIKQNDIKWGDDNHFATFVQNGSQPGLIGNTQFPSDLGTDQRPNYIVIYINEIQSSTWLAQGGRLSTWISSENPVAADHNSGAASQSKDASVSKVASEFSKSQFKRLKSVIALPMPMQLPSNLNINWEAGDNSGPTGMASKLYNEGLAAFSSKIGVDAGATTRKVFNSKRESSFQGVGQRQFEFSWDLYPRSLDEAKSIWNIIQVLKTFSLPMVTDLGTALLSPAIFDFEFHNKGQRNDWLPRSTSCAIVNIQLSYIMQQGFEGFDISDKADVTWEQFGHMVGLTYGSPSVGINMSVSFAEIEVLTRDRIDPDKTFNFTLNQTKDSQGIF